MLEGRWNDVPLNSLSIESSTLENVYLSGYFILLHLIYFLKVAIISTLKKYRSQQVLHLVMVCPGILLFLRYSVVK